MQAATVVFAGIGGMARAGFEPATSRFSGAAERGEEGGGTQEEGGEPGGR
jgi:hypothetical protein